MPRLEFEDAVLFMKKAVEEKGPDYVYEPLPRKRTNVVRNLDGTFQRFEDTVTGCFYRVGDAPSCLVGHVFAQVEGVAPPGDWDDEMEGMSPAEAGSCVDIEMDERTAQMLEQAQDCQDNGTPWGEAMEFALSAVKHE